MKMKVEICGYTQEEHCDHCGRALKHVVITDTQGKIGTSCFLKITKPKTYNGKVYTMTANTIKDIAKQSMLSETRQQQLGILPNSFIFELKD